MFRFLRIDFARPPAFNITEAAITAADRPHQQKRRRPGIEAFAAIGAIGLFANGVQSQAAKTFSYLLVFISAECPDLQPGRPPQMFFFVRHPIRLYVTFGNIYEDGSIQIEIFPLKKIFFFRYL